MGGSWATIRSMTHKGCNGHLAGITPETKKNRNHHPCRRLGRAVVHPTYRVVTAVFGVSMWEVLSSGTTMPMMMPVRTGAIKGPAVVVLMCSQQQQQQQQQQRRRKWNKQNKHTREREREDARKPNVWDFSSLQNTLEYDSSSTIHTSSAGMVVPYNICCWC
eukprot:scaffold36777_cov199-Amphora_coffeaeformis.AAC.4